VFVPPFNYYRGWDFFTFEIPSIYAKKNPKPHGLYPVREVPQIPPQHIYEKTHRRHREEYESKGQRPYYR